MEEHNENCSHCQEKERNYKQKLRQLEGKFPNLRNGEWKRRRPGIESSPGRLLCYEFGQTRISKTEMFESPNTLRQYLESTPRTSDGAPFRRLFIMEGVDDTYKTIIGAQLKIRALFWFRHSKFAAWSSNSEGDGNVPSLASLTNSERSMQLPYCQLVRMSVDEQDTSLHCAEDERHIASSRVDGKFDGIGTIHRKASFWALPVGDGGWDSLLVVDRPFRKILAGSEDQWHTFAPEVGPTPFQGGYADFMEYADIDEATLTQGPPRTSFFDDLRYYFENHFDSLRLTSSPRSALVFAEKIVASEYMLLIQYHQNLLCHLQWRLSRNDHFVQFKIDWIEQTWSDLMAFQRRLDNRRISVQDIIRRLDSRRNTTRTTSPSQQVLPQSNWHDTKQDFVFIEAQLTHLLRKTETLVTAFTALSSTTATQQSLAEARAVRSLTFLGMVFLPLSLVAALFSMRDDYQPGGPHFWKYIIVCVPLVIVVVGLVLLQTNASRLLEMFRNFRTQREKQIRQRDRINSMASTMSTTAVPTSASSPTPSSSVSSDYDPKAVSVVVMNHVEFAGEMV